MRPDEIENFIGVAQVPLGIAGPLLVNGEHARGEFYVPLATTEGTLAASYNPGMKLLRAAGGVKATVMDDRMQLAPAFGFECAREARAFGQWVTASFDDIKRAADATTRKLAEIVAAAVLCGELSLGPAVVAGERVDAHERLGRNRP